jgi:hypothetical protein
MEYVNLNLVKKSTTVFKGFGSSLVWFANVIGKSDDKESVDFLCDILFNKKNPNGLHLNFVRYCIGGVEDPSLAKNFRIGGAIESYTKYRDWDTVDLGQRYFLKKSKELGVEHFEAFSNSPPNSMTVSGSTAGSEPWNIPFIKSKITFSNNLKSECVEEFSSYLVNVTQYLSEHDNIPFTSISPINEALNPGWISTNNQEGCYYDLFGIRRKLMYVLRKELDKKNMTHVDLAGYDENSIFFGLLSLVLNPFNYQRFNIHRYSWGDAFGFNTYGFEDNNIFRIFIKWILKDKPISISEFGMGYMNGITRYDDFQTVLLLADKIMDDFIYLQPNLYCYWQVIEDLTGNGWGLCQVSFDDPSKIVYGAQYACFMHFSHFIKPGDILLQLPKLKNKNLKWIGSQNKQTINLVILSNNYLDTTLHFNNYFTNTVISISNKQNFKCNNIIKTNISGKINKIVIPSYSLVSVSFTNC